MKKLFIFLLMLGAALGLHAQVTTGTLTGTIRDGKETLPGVSIKATHVPSGTNYTTTTNQDGRYTIPNLRPGGPYKLQFTYVGRAPKTLENITVGLGDPYLLNLNLEDNGTNLNEVTIKGAGKNPLLNANRTGTSTNLGKEEINSLPTLNRSLNDLIRMAPQANGASIGGGNSRQNNVTVDGADFNNNFGIGNNLPGNGNPVSIDALEEISVNVTPYDVKQSGFIGASINAVTRSGTNEFSGSAYTYFRNENHIGKKVSNYPKLTDPTAQTYKTFGARVGGPIIKNKLFFFLNAEREEQVTPGPSAIAATAANPFGSTNVRRPTATELNDISNYLRTTYGYETGPYQGYGNERERTNILARLDWNINTNNRFNIRGSYVKTKNPSSVSTSRSPLGAFPGGGSRTGSSALPFQNANYYQESNLYSITAELNSTLGKAANTLRLSYTNQNDPRSSDSDIFPLVDILKSDVDANGNAMPATPFTTFGYEPFTYGNLRDVQVFSVNDYITWSAGKHNFTAGLQGEYNITKNGFQRFGTSYYTFNSWDDFKNGVKPIEFAQTYSLNEGYEQAFPTFKFMQFSGYVQDEISVTDRFRITGGIRFDLGTYPKILKEHPLVSALSFQNGERLNTGNLPKARVAISPRFGFNWDAKGDRSLQFRGGAGIFTGKIPNVWIVAQAGDAGMLQITETYSGQNNTPGPFNPNIGAYRPATVPVAGTVLPNPITVMDENLKMPSVLKASVAMDIKLPGGLVGSLEGIYNKDLRTVLFRNANLVDPKPLNVSKYPDNRMIYPNANTDKFINPILNGVAVPNGTVIPGNGAQPGAFNVIVLENANKGHYYSVTASLAKHFSNGFGARLSYIRSEAKSLYEGGGDQTLSSWQSVSTVDGANKPVLGYSGFVAPSRVIASVFYRKEFIKHLGTQVTLVYDGANGRQSYTYSADLNRDGATGDLIYVPNDATEIDFVPLTIGSGANAVTYTAKQQSDLFFRFVERDSYLRGRKGKYAERNGALTPFNGQFDFRLQQDIFTNIGGKRNTIQFNWDVVNFGNLLNKNWGVQRSSNTSSILVPTNVASLTPGGTTRPTFRLATESNTPITHGYRDSVGFGSTWSMQFGFRYIFN